MNAPRTDDDRVDSAVSESLRPRERLILDELGREPSAFVAFQGLRRRLNLHPQALTRSLRSLERAGHVQHAPEGYRVRLSAPTASSGSVGLVARGHPILAAVLPTHLSTAALAESLSHRWFQGLRWYGSVDSGDERLLVWTSEGTGQRVNLRIGGRLVGLEVEAAGPDPLPFRAIAPLMSALAALYARPIPSGTRELESEAGLPKLAG